MIKFKCTLYDRVVHLMSREEGNRADAPAERLLLEDGNTFQNLRVSSPAPVTMLWPSGLKAR
jgi:hypothetical protein